MLDELFRSSLARGNYKVCVNHQEGTEGALDVNIELFMRWNLTLPKPRA